MNGRMILLAMFLAAASRGVGADERYHKTPKTVSYKCLFNHELLIVCHNKDMSSQSIGAFVEKLADTDVDAVMCCPTMWRTNVFPSKVDLGWKKYSPDQPSSKFRSYDYVMKYLHAGGDPVRDTLEACRKCGKDFFISYRMNDHHYVTDLTWPTHNFIWRDHSEYWMGDSETSPYSRKDDIRLLNYMLPEVRDYYFAILEELCTNYDVDGLELDFQRFPKFFRSSDLEQGRPIMTAFVRRIRTMLDRIGSQRGKTLQLCVRVPETLAKCQEAGLDIPGWDAKQLVDMINVSSFYIHTIELGIEAFQAKTSHAKVYGEMNYVTYQKTPAERRYTTFQIYRASAFNLYHRGVDGLSLFNYDYVPSNQRPAMAEGLKRITDLEFLKTASKDYAVYPGFGTFTAGNEKTLKIVIPDDTSAVKFDHAVMRVETKQDCSDLQIDVSLNGTALKPLKHKDTELFPPVAKNESYPTYERLKFYSVPLNLLVPGKNTIHIKNVDREKHSINLFSMELGLYR